MKRRYEIWGLLFLALLAWAIYLKTLAPTLYLEDSGEFISSAYVLGINHPPGYPLFTLGNKVISRLALGAIPFRINLFGALVAVFGLVLFVQLLGELGLRFNVRVGGTLLLAVSRLWWSQAIQPEVYLLNGVFALLILLCFIQGAKRSNTLALFFGLGLANHYLILGFFPLLLYVCFKKQKRPFKIIASSVFLLLLGMMVYLYLPLRGSAVPAVNWHLSPATFSGTTVMLSRRQFKRIEFSHKVTLLEKWQFLGDFARKLAEQGTVVLIVLAGLGFSWLYRRKKSLLFWLGSLFLANSVALIFILRFPFDSLKTYTITPYYLVAYLVIIILAAAGLNLLGEKRRLLGLGLGLILWIGLMFLNGPKVNARSFYVAYDFGDNLISNTGGEGVIMVAGIYQFFPLMYFKLVENRLPNLMIAETTVRSFSSYREVIARKALYLMQRPLNMPGERFAAQGLLYRREDAASNVVLPQWDKLMVMRGLLSAPSAPDFSHPERVIRRYYSRYYLRQAQAFSKEQKSRGVNWALSVIKKADPDLVIPPGLFAVGD